MGTVCQQGKNGAETARLGAANNLRVGESLSSSVPREKYERDRTQRYTNIIIKEEQTARSLRGLVGGSRDALSLTIWFAMDLSVRWEAPTGMT
jgi:hypothetical protein